MCPHYNAGNAKKCGLVNDVEWSNVSRDTFFVSHAIDNWCQSHKYKDECPTYRMKQGENK